MTMRVVAVTGWSGSGKTTLLTETIAHLVARGHRVAAMKHTHHPVNDDEARGDTSRFRAAGADPVVLASGNEAVFFRAAGTETIPYGDPAELVARINADILLVEGFKERDDWPKLELSAPGRRTPEDVLAILDRIEGS